MATTLQLPSFPRHGILLNSPSTSPYSHTTSLPGTPHLVSSLSSLSSSASSTSPHTSEADGYFHTYSAFSNSYSAAPRGGSAQTSSNVGLAPSKDEATKKSASAPQTRKIRFAPLPEPRRDEQALPDVFLDDSVENLNTFLVNHESVETPRSNPNSRPSSLLFSGNGHVDSQAPSDTTPTTSNPNLQLGASLAKPSVSPLTIAPSSTSGSEDSDWDNITTPISPNTILSSSVERLPQSCPESPLNRRTDLPREKKSLTKKLLKPLFGRNISTEDVLTLGVNQLFRSSTRESDDGMSSGAATPAGYSTPSRNRSKERTSSLSDGECGFGAPLCRSTSDNTAQKKSTKRKMSFLGFNNSSSNDDGLWRTQSASGDMRRVKSRESEDVKRPRSGSSNGAYGPRRQLRMLNGRIYGAKRSNLANTNLFATARYVLFLSPFSLQNADIFNRSEEPEFVEWGYGGMGSVKTAASVGADNKWSRVQGSSAIGIGAGESGWEKGSRGRAPVDPDDDGSGMAWLKKRREQREKEKKDAEAQAETSAEEKENHQTQQPHAEVADPDPPHVEEEMPVEANEDEDVQAKIEPEHITTAVTVPAHHRPTHHHSRSMERVPSSASHMIKSPERRDSEDTARAVSPPTVPVSCILDAQEMVGEMDAEIESDNIGRARRESHSSTNSTSSSVGTDDEYADVEDSPKDSYGEDDEEESEDDVSLRIYRPTSHVYSRCAFF